MKLFHTLYIVLLTFLLALLLICIGARAEAEAEAIPPEVNYGGLLEQEQIQIPLRYTETDLYNMAVMLAGECYPWDTEDMRNAAITVCNRVDDSRWSQDTITEVIQQTGYYGYNAGNTPTETHLSVAKAVLDDWCAIAVGIDRPWADWLYFSAVNGTNIYRTSY